MKESWYACKLSDMDVIRISESDEWIVDYDRKRGMYRVSYFKDNHFVDEHWFDAYEEKECEHFGYWYKEENDCVIRCSTCKERLDLRYPDGTDVQNLSYCPNCGAKMIGQRVAYENSKEVNNNDFKS